MKKIIKFISALTVLTIVATLSINILIILTTRNQIKKIENIELEDVDCILVLGAGIKNNKPSPMLEDRLQTGIELYEKNISKKILVSGDHTKIDYDEVNVMKNYLKENNIPSNDIFMDHTGISTYDSIYRAKKIYKAKKIIIVTQEYHLYRSLYIANRLGIDAYGIAADKKEYPNQDKRDLREIAARIKDFIKCLIKSESAYLGEVFPINGNGDETNDK